MKRSKGSRRVFRIERLETRTLLAADPVITELMASNRSSLDDGNGRSSDWIELHNRGDETADLGGWYLTDDLTRRDRWRFPPVQIEPDEYLVVFASGTDVPNYLDQAGFLHTNFRLSASGEQLALVRPDLTVAQQIDFPPQYSDVSFGFSQPNLDQIGYFSLSTPGSRNVNVRSGVTENVVAMSKESGVFTESFQVKLTTTAAASTIVYSLDGTIPNEVSQQYTNPVEITSSTQLRARVMETNRVLGPVKTASFIKADAEVAAFTSQLPIMVIDNFDGGDIPNTGWNQTNTQINQLPRQPANLMLFDADQADATLTSSADISSRIGIRIRGAFSSTFREPGYSVETWSDDANTDADVSPLGIAADSDWVLYAPNPQYDQTLIDNSFLFELSNQMGQWAPEVRYVETFVNTDGGELTMRDHVGLYVLTEKVKRSADRINFEEFAVDGSSGGWLLDFNRMDPISLDGTQPKNFHTAGADGILQTDRDLWRTSGRGDDIPRQYNAYINYDDPSGLTINPQQRDSIAAWFERMEAVLYGRADNVAWNDPTNGYAKYIDVGSFIDYFILNDISRNGDGLLISLWVYNADPNGDGKLQIGPIWDADLGSFSESPTADLMRRKDRLWYGRMFEDPNFALRFTERWQELRRGVLSDANMFGIIDQFHAQIGDDAAGRDRVRNWTTRLDRMKSWLVDRAEAIDALFLAPPKLNQLGGEVEAGFEVTMFSERGDVYYTLDGSDPRTPRGTPAPEARRVETEAIPFVTGSTAASIIIPDESVDAAIGHRWIATDFVEGAAGEQWSEGRSAVGYDRRGRLTDLIETDLVDVDHSVYVRIAFEVTADQLESARELSFYMQYDDGFVAYLNGQEVARSNAPGDIGQPIPIDVNADRAHRVQLDEFDRFPLSLTSLNVGTNVLAIQGLNRSRTDSDLLIRPELVGLRLSSPPIVIREPTGIVARTKDGEEWSAPVTAEFVPRVGIPGDFDGDGRLTANDVDRLCEGIRNDDLSFDLTQDNSVDRSDLEFYLTRQLMSTYGDANADRIFDTGDLVLVFQAGQYEDDIVGNSTWSTGDWDCDGEFGSSDLVLAFQQGGFTP